MLEYEFEDSMGYWIAITAHAMRRALDAELARERITFRQWEVLAWLALSGEQSQGELAERLGVEAPTLAGILARMERDGWLERRGCPNDRRRKIIRPTVQSDEVWGRMVACCRRVRAQAIDGIPTADLDKLKQTCEQIRRNLSADDHATPAAATRPLDKLATDLIVEPSE